MVGIRVACYAWVRLLPANCEKTMIESPSLLITDDDSAFRETLRGVFEPEGYRTLLAGDGEEALRTEEHTSELQSQSFIP